MRVITEERLQNTLFSEIQSIARANGTCHYEGYKNWCISGEEVEQAIKNIFAQNDLFKPTVDIVLCEDCKHHEHCEVETLLRYVDHIESPYCAAGERKDNDI